MRTRIKICGLTREADIEAAVMAGADALGFVFYAASPRAVTLQRAAALCRHVPPFVSIVGLFVNAGRANVAEHIAELPLSVLQFHGDETPADCQGFALPYIKAVRVKPGVDLVNSVIGFDDAQGVLLDAWVDGYGGGGHVFDWGLIPQQLPAPLILSGGLRPENVQTAVQTVRPWAVDVSTGVEVSKGIKDAAKIAAFVAGVRNADE